MIVRLAALNALTNAACDGMAKGHEDAFPKRLYSDPYLILIARVPCAARNGLSVYRVNMITSPPALGGETIQAGF